MVVDSSLCEARSNLDGRNHQTNCGVVCCVVVLVVIGPRGQAAAQVKMEKREKGRGSDARAVITSRSGP